VAKSANNPKFIQSNEGQDAAQQKPLKGQNVGGKLDAEVRFNTWIAPIMLSRQLRRNKSGSSPL